MAKRLWFVRTRHKVTQYGITELRDRLAAAIKIARRYSRQCDAYRAELVRLRHDAAPQVQGPGGFLLRAYDAVPANPPYEYPYLPATSESFDESAAATMVATEPLLAADWDGADDCAAWDAADATPPPRGANYTGSAPDEPCDRLDDTIDYDIA